MNMLALKLILSETQFTAEAQRTQRQRREEARGFSYYLCVASAFSAPLR
jgi:hypothetical protein